jgi:hypothetical protein
MIWLFISWFLVTVLVSITAVVWAMEWRYEKSIHEWVDLRDEYIQAIMTHLYTVTSVPNHSSLQVSSGLVTHGGVPLNFDTLKDMTTVMLAQEEDRRSAAVDLRYAINRLATWEQDHPVPEPMVWPLRSAFFSS